MCRTYVANFEFSRSTFWAYFIFILVISALSSFPQVLQLFEHTFKKLRDEMRTNAALEYRRNH